ncbi:hypothetical protein B296_00052036 [Ensete ventricosum]|uniref:Cation-transporting P-type ATPase N-terminal domain-containing protein n=1 Tax=Ensete ventricosum TaxID=4639 RepID=A0A426X778_ENSVE|nr:hypothetical protein B296_00052036 [Ensete ventricosum]
MATDLELIKNESVDLVTSLPTLLLPSSSSLYLGAWSDSWCFFFFDLQESIPVEEVFAQLKCGREGLTSAEGEQRLLIFGLNKLEEKQVCGEPPDWQDFIGIVVLLIINSTISFIEENNAGNAAAALMAGLAPKTKIIDLCNMKEDAKKKVHAMIDNFAERGLRALGVARQEVPAANKESAGDPWQFIGLLPLFDPPRHDSAETIRQALHLGVNVKMITGDQLAIGKETGRRLGMGTNMYPSSTLLGDKNDNVTGLPIDELIEKADGFAGVFPGNHDCTSSS